MRWRPCSARVADPELRVAFAAPAGATWPLPLYELALLTAAALRERGVPDPDLTVVTAEERPLAALGVEATDAVLGALDGAGIDVIVSAAARAAVEARCACIDGARRGRRRRGCAAGRRGSPHPGPAARRRRLPGGRRARPRARLRWSSTPPATPTRSLIKHGSLAAAQADAIAETIAARAGALVDPEPFRPVLQGMLLTGADPLYIRAELGVSATVTTELLWSPPAKIKSSPPHAVPRRLGCA